MPRTNPIDTKTPADTNRVVQDTNPSKSKINDSIAGKPISGLLTVFVQIKEVVNGLFGTADIFPDSIIRPAILRMEYVHDLDFDR